MQTEKLVNVTPQVEAQSALEELRYQAGLLAQYATTVYAIRSYTQEDYAVGYLRLVTETVDKIKEQNERLFAALKAASLQQIAVAVKESAA